MTSRQAEARRRLLNNGGYVNPVREAQVRAELAAYDREHEGDEPENDATDENYDETGL